MTECLPDLPRYIRQRDNEWQGADHQNGPWRPIPAPQSGLPWKTDESAVPESREPASVAPDARPLSPAAQVVLDAFIAARRSQTRTAGRHQALAAALSAVADQVVPSPRLPHDSCCDVSAAAIRAKILAIATELKKPNA